MSYIVRTQASPAYDSPLVAPEADDSFGYIVCRGLSFWPTFNRNNAAWFEEDLAPLVGTERGFKFGLANVNHRVGPNSPMQQIIGSVRDEALVDGSGVDLLVQVDKRILEAYDIEPSEFINGDFTKASIEILCDRDKSQFIVLLNPETGDLANQKVFNADEAARLGIRRTDPADPDPYLYEDRYTVVERCYPLRCRGVALLDQPADTTANVFEVAAGVSTVKHPEPYGPDAQYADPGFRGKKRYPTDTKEHTLAAASYFGKPENRDKYTPEQREHIDRAILEAKKRHSIGETDAGVSSEDMPSVSPTSNTSETDVMPMAKYYADDDAVDVMACDELPDEAFADVNFDPYEVVSERAYPVYASKEAYLADKPHPGLMKAALKALQDGKIRDSATALTKLRQAHSKLVGDTMDEKERLAQEKAQLETTLSEVRAQLETANGTASAKDTEIAELKSKIGTAETELAEVRQAMADRDSTEKANQRLAKLGEVEGFEVKDEEKAALVEALKGEDEVTFENRLLKAKIAGMETAAAKKKAEEQAAKENRDEEVAAARAGLDIFPTNGTEKEKVTKLIDVM